MFCLGSHLLLLKTCPISQQRAYHKDDLGLGFYSFSFKANRISIIYVSLFVYLN